MILVVMGWKVQQLALKQGISQDKHQVAYCDTYQDAYHGLLDCGLLERLAGAGGSIGRESFALTASSRLSKKSALLTSLNEIAAIIAK